MTTRDWSKRMADAQKETTVELAGRTYRRAAYGPDHPDIDVKPECRDCGVKIGQLHVLSCCVERCPRCGGQAISCDCDDTPHEIH